MTGNKIEWVDAIKGIAICGVVLTHAGIRGNKLIAIVEEAGATGVQIFFIISAFLVYASLTRTFSQYQYTLKNKIIWFGTKLLRIAPLYYLFLLVHICMHTSSGPISVSNILTHLLFVNGFFS